jgi:hypothetical protein
VVGTPRGLLAIAPCGRQVSSRAQSRRLHAIVPKHDLRACVLQLGRGARDIGEPASVIREGATAMFKI